MSNMETHEKIDLHIHSDFSDGLLSVEEIFRIAKKAKFKTISITDHDTNEHWEEVERIGQQRNIPYILGTEFSAMYKGNEIHILGYNYDKENMTIKNILNDYKDSNVRWIVNMLINFSVKTGNTVDFSNFPLKGSPDKVRITKFLLDNGYIHLENEELFSNLVTRTFKQGGIFHKKRTIKRRKAQEIIQAIHSAGGISVIAHPQKNKLEEHDIKNLVNFGLNGIEVFSKKQLQNTDNYLNIAEKFNLLITGGSDFHGNGQLGVEHEQGIFDKFIRRNFNE